MKTEQEHIDFLSMNGICCDSCFYWNKNMKMPNVKEDVCIHPKNKQNTVYGESYFVPEDDSFACSKWEEFV